jgi:hypothetical protein
MNHAGLLTIDANVVLKHLDRFGNAKPIFQENKLLIALIDNGILSPLWINTLPGRIVSHLGIFGFWSDEKDAHNLITTVGNAAVAGLINGVGSVATFASIGQGTGVTAAAIGDTALQTGVTAGGAGDSGVHAVASATASLVTTTGTNDTAQFVGTVSETATIAITESGVFNATTNGTLLCHQVFSAVNVVSGDSLQFTWKIKVA